MENWLSNRDWQEDLSNARAAKKRLERNERMKYAATQLGKEIEWPDGAVGMIYDHVNNKAEAFSVDNAWWEHDGFYVPVDGENKFYPSTQYWWCPKWWCDDSKADGDA